MVGAGRIEHQTTNLGVWSSNLSGRAKLNQWLTPISFRRQTKPIFHSGAQLGAHDERLVPARRPRTRAATRPLGRQRWANYGLCRARRRRICRVMKPRSCCLVVRRSGRDDGRDAIPRDSALVGLRSIRNAESSHSSEHPNAFTSFRRSTLECSDVRLGW
jgi:hypothetical protein